MPIKSVKDQTYHAPGDPTQVTMNKRGGKKYKTPPTEGSATQKRKANLANHMQSTSKFR